MNAEIFFDSAPPTSISIERSISGHQNVVNELRGGGDTLFHLAIEFPI
jgi:hypothetical protein